MEKKALGEHMDLVDNEIGILARLNHPRIITVIHCFQDKDYFHYVMQCCQGGDIFNHSTRKTYNMSEQHIAQVLAQVLESIAYYHSQNVVHRDLKLENIVLIDKYSAFTVYPEIKLIDFGLATTLK